MNTKNKTYTYEKALRAIQDELPADPRLPLVVKIKEIVDEALASEPKEIIDPSVALTQPDFFGPEERVANATQIARAAVRSVLKYIDHDDPRFTPCAEWLTFLTYPGNLENIVLVNRALDAHIVSAVECVLNVLNINADFPRFDTLSREVRKAVATHLFYENKN